MCDSHLSSLSSGFFYTVFIDNNYNLWSFGRSIYGNLGYKTEDYNIGTLPCKIESLVNIKTVSCGGHHTICCNFNGDVFSFGSNKHGQLGINKSEKEISSTYIPQQVEIPNIYQISCGDAFTICLSFTGELWAFGDGKLGQLGTGKEEILISPVCIPNLDNIEFVSCGGYHTYCKTMDDEIYSWGYNRYGQLGYESKNMYSCLPMKSDIFIYHNIISIKCGEYHTLFLHNNGDIYSCGDNNHGALGLGLITKAISTPILIKDIPKIALMSCGAFHSICVDIDNKLWVFGENSSAELGLGDYTMRSKPTQNTFITNVKAISNGGYSTIIQTESNIIYGCGAKLLDSKPKIKPTEFLPKENKWNINIRRTTQKSARK